jgi:hypothetical protein
MRYKMKDGRRAKFRQIKGKPTHLKPKIVMKEVCGQVVPVKVYPAQYAKDESTHSLYPQNSEKKPRAVDDTARGR